MRRRRIRRSPYRVFVNGQTIVLPSLAHARAEAKRLARSGVRAEAYDLLDPTTRRIYEPDPESPFGWKESAP